MKRKVDIQIDQGTDTDYYLAEIMLEHKDCEWRCGQCSGSGEGQADGTTCYVCKGSGVHKNPDNQEALVSLIWAKEDLSDLATENGDPYACEYCGEDFVELAKEELRCQVRLGKILLKKPT